MKTLNEAIEAIEALQSQVKHLEEAVVALSNGKQRGPKTDRAMTDEDAFRVKFGDLKGKNHKEAAAELGLSYGQVFSCRGSYTFKHVKTGWTPTAKAEESKE
jgi:hypothetical protein